MKKRFFATFLLFCVLGLSGVESGISVSGFRCWPKKDHVEIRKVKPNRVELRLLKGSLVLEQLLEIQPYFVYEGTLEKGNYLLEFEVISTRDAKMQVRIQKNIKPWKNFAALSVWNLKAGEKTKIRTSFRLSNVESGNFRMPGFRFANVEEGAQIIFTTPVIRKVK